MAYDRAPRQDRGSQPPESSPSLGGGGGGGTGSGAVSQKGGTYFLGRYRVVDEIGIGGMASVHLGRMDGPGGFQKWVAIKRIHAHLVEDDSFIQMFLDEARVAARISHPNVATVFELGKHEDTYWIAMEYLHGEPLREVMRRTEELGAPMPPEIACRVIADAAEGLHAAHELLGKNGEKLNLIHRDVTPHNLFVTYDGTTKVVDFGIAKFSSRMSNTRAGTLKGKLAYMSPEQVHGETIDRRTDIFALGVVLWELTTGQRLFRMDSDLDTLAKVQECNVPRPSSLIRGYPVDLEKIVMKALAKNRGERFKTAREFSRALQSLLMRRGLFIASDEVASYVQSIFSERIQKREAHLRWAAEVTQTISLSSALGLSGPAGGEGASLISFSSDIQPSAPSTRAAPRPAAGAPPPRLGTGFSQGSGPSNSSGAQTAPRGETVRPPARAPNPPPAFAPPPFPAGPFPPPSVPTGPTPIDAGYEGDGPTIQGSVDMSDDDDELFDDNDDTIVTSAAKNDPVTATGAMRPSGPRPAAGAPAAFNTSGETRAASPLARDQSIGSYPRAPNPDHTYQSEAETLLHAPSGGSAINSTQPLQSSDAFAAALLPAAVPSAPRLFAPDMGGRTVTARALQRGLPMWAVAAGSGLVALLFVILIYSLISSIWGSKDPVANRPSPSSAASSPAAPMPAAGASGSPFAAARSGFLGAITPTRPTTLAPVPPTPVTPQHTPSASPTAAAERPTQTITQPTGTHPTGAPHPGGGGGSAGTKPVPARAPQGFLTILCKPACDQILDNSKPLGSSPIFRQPVPVGEHRLHLKTNSPPLTKVLSVVVMADELKTINVPMTP